MRTTLVCAVLVLVVIGVAAAVGRAIFIGDWAHRAEPLRVRMLLAMGYNDRDIAHQPQDLVEVDDKFGNHRVTTWLHVIPGAVFLLLAPIQFLPSIRNRFLGLHRWLGRILIVAALISGAAGLFFGLFLPLGGFKESIPIAIFGALLFFSAIRGYIAIRRGEVRRHREWMIRAFAVALAIATVRVVLTALDMARIMAADPRALFVVSIWSGWLITLAVAEAWIRYTRGRVEA
ncbi:MAG TPA: DUF2306 domain-containing protein [Thermoanaerobaculia bacterium]|nr:DUF2306 domain-containing protein [Thermoanaerobaculia bacterium]